MRFFLILGFCFFGFIASAGSFEQEWGQDGAVNNVWSPTAKDSCEHLGATVISGFYYKGEFYDRDEEGNRRFEAICIDSYDNTSWTELTCKVTDENDDVSRFLGLCPTPTSICPLNKGNPIDLTTRAKNETSADWRSSKDERFAIERHYRSTGELASGYNGREYPKLCV